MIHLIKLKMCINTIPFLLLFLKKVKKKFTQLYLAPEH